MKKLTILFFILVFFKSLQADTFIVTSNADSGPGTLRQAIIDAGGNGNAVSDLITFNLPDQSATGRRIVLLSPLPPLSSNLTIDGTTQPGIPFGISDARIDIFLEYQTNDPQIAVTIKGCNGIKIYGLKLNCKLTSPLALTIDVTAFYIRNSSDVEFGNIGKGNMIVNFTHALRIEYELLNASFENNKNIRIYSNFLGLNEDGETPEYNVNLIVSNRIEDIEIGGMDPRQGNMMAADRNRIKLTGTKGKILIAHNKMGTNYTGTKMLSLPYLESSRYHDNIFIGGGIDYFRKDKETEIRVLNNLISGTTQRGIHVLGYTKKIYIQGNKIGTDITGTKSLNTFMDCGISIENCENVIVGVENDEAKEKNIIAFAKRGTPIFGGDVIGVIVHNGNKGITISRNSIFCNGVGISLRENTYPIITINKIIGGTLSGTSPPNSRIEVFKDDECPGCEGKTFIEAFNSDAAGNWNYNHSEPSSLVFTATDSTGMTTEFTKGIIDRQNIRVKPSTCGLKNGSISGIKIISGTWWQWEDENGNVVSRDTNLTNVSEGRYKLTVGIQEKICAVASWFQIWDLSTPVSPMVYTSNASCGLANGSLSTNPSSGYRIVWINALGDSLGTGPTFNNAMPGSYMLKIILQNDPSCFSIYGPYSIKNLSGPELDLSNMRIKNAECGLSNGGVSGITVINQSGSAFIQWQDSTGRALGSSFDLVNKAPGRYRLLFKDATGCDTIKSNYFIIPPEGVITIDTTARIIEHVTCKRDKGSIKNIKVTGGSDFTWTNPAGVVMAKTVDVSNLPPGMYKLHVGNSTGCSVPAPSPFEVLQYGFDSVFANKVESRNAICGQNNGFIRITSFSKDSLLYNFQWRDSTTGKVIGNYGTINSLGPGNYQLFATDRNGCTARIYSEQINAMARPSIDADQMKITNDVCSQKQGTIIAGKINGLIGPTTYTWTDEANHIVGNAADLKNIGAGIYKLTVVDAGVCTIESPPITLKNTNDQISAPVYNPVLVPRNSAAVIRPASSGSGVYRLFATTGGNYLQQNTTGEFTISNITNDTAVYIQRVLGSCSSSMVRVEIKAVERSYFAIPNAFTPNGDGKNDRLNLKVIGYIDVKYFRIFNNFGEMIFQTSQINSGWDGRIKGVMQNTGTYVWMAEGKDLQGNIIRSKGTITLIR